MRSILTAVAALIAAVLAATPTLADDEAGEVWLNPSVAKVIDSRMSIELETAQRLRQDPRDDTYFVRAWVNRDDSLDNTWSVGLEQRWNGPDQREVRLLQQVKFGLGPLDFRTRLEQRFVNTDPNTGWRLRQRVGSSLPLSADEDGWALTGDAEFFFTLRPTQTGGQTGLTGLRTFVGVEREFGPYEVSLGYLRQQDIRNGAEDRVGHAPFIGVALTF